MKYPQHMVWSIDFNNFPFGASLKKQSEFLLGYAILSPSAHNAQPWKVKIETDGILVFFDTKCELPQSDPLSRQAFLSLGAFVNNFCTAADAFGLKSDVTWLPDISIEYAVAQITVRGTANHGLTDENPLDLIVNRSVDRSIYLNKDVPSDLEIDLQRFLPEGLEIKVIKDKSKRSRLAKCVSKGMEFAFKNTNFRRELSCYVVPNSSSSLVGIPGYTAGLNSAGSRIIPRMMWYFDIGKSQSDLEYKRFYSSPAIVVIGSKVDNPRSWLVTGYWYQCIVLELTKRRIAHAISGAPIEAPLLPQKVQSIVESEYRPLMFFRIGYSDQKTIHSPRRPVSDILIT